MPHHAMCIPVHLPHRFKTEAFIGTIFGDWWELEEITGEDELETA